MCRSKRFLSIAVTLMTATGIFFATEHSFAADTHSGQAVQESGKAGSHASNSAAHAIMSTGQVTSAVSAVPLSIGGAAGAVSSEIANDLVDAATAPAGKPLQISDESVTVGPPPDKALKTPPAINQKRRTEAKTE